MSQSNASNELNQITCCDEWKFKIKKILFTENQINTRIVELASILSNDFKNKNVLCVGIMNGCLMFMTHLLEKVSFKYKMDCISLSSYGHSTETTGIVSMKKDLNIDPEGYDVLIIEDLIDSGVTLDWLQQYFTQKKCNSVSICCLLDKKERRKKDVKVDYVGFECPNEFVIGYGMDYEDEYRCLPFVACL